MKNKFLYLFITVLIGVTGCKQEKFADYYLDPAGSTTTTVEQQFSGYLASFLDYEMYRYWNYFVVLQGTLLHYTQAASYQNTSHVYEPGGQAVQDRWNAYYAYLAQYKEFLKVYAGQTNALKAELRIFKIAADINFFDQTQKVIDLHGNIPWEAAGLLSTNGGDYKNSYPKYDDAGTIYTTMLDSLKSYASELNTLTISSASSGHFKNQDFINNGDILLWKKYCNSLRIRMLMRISGVASFQARENTEIGQIGATPVTFPVCTVNDDNIIIDVRDVSSSVNSDCYNGIIGWGGNDIPTKSFIDTLKNNNDPRLRLLFQPGANAGSVYTGLDLTLSSGAQTALINGGTLSRYNFGLTKSRKVPGVLITASEVQLLLSDYYLNIANNDANAKSAYESGISLSIDFYYYLRSISDNTDGAAGTLVAVTPAEKTALLNTSNISWANATTTAKKKELIAVQKWVNYNIFQPNENWAEYRRTNLPALVFASDGTSTISALPPVRLPYPESERTYNAVNYQAVSANDKLTTKIFWDIN